VLLNFGRLPPCASAGSCVMRQGGCSIASAMKVNELQSEYADEVERGQADKPSGGDATVRRVFLDDDEATPGHIAVMVPYWVYRRIWHALVAMGASTKPEEYIVAILEGHVRKLNL